MTHEQEQAIRERLVKVARRAWPPVKGQEYVEHVSRLLAALDAARAERVALLPRLEALEQRYRAEAHVDDSNPRGGLYERIIDDLASLRQEMR